MTLRRNTAEGQTTGTTLTAANSGGSSGDAFDSVTIGASSTCKYDSAQAMHGTQSYRITVTTTTDTVTISYTGANDTSEPAVIYIRFNSLPSAAQQIMTLRNSGGVAAVFAITAANKFVVQNAAGTSISAWTGTFTTGVWYRCELIAFPGTTTSNGTINGAYYTGDSNTATETFASGATVNAGTTNITQYRFGKLSAVGTLDAWFDDPGCNNGATAFIGPTSAAATGTAALTLSGTPVWIAPAATGTLTVTGAAAQPPSAATGTLTLTGAATQPATPATAALTFSSAVSGLTTPASASGGLTLAGSAPVPETATASLTFSTAAQAVAVSTAAITFTAATTIGPSTATGAVVLTGAASARAPASTGALTLTATPAPTTPATASLTLTAAATPRAPAATGALTLSGIVPTRVTGATAAITLTGSAAGRAAGLIGVTLDETASSSRTVALPTAPPGGYTAGMYVLAVFASSSSTPITITPARGTWQTVVDAPANNMYVYGILHQLDATDILNGTIAFATSTGGAANGLFLAAFDGTYLGLDPSVSLPVTPGTRGGTSQTFTVAPAVTPSGASVGLIVGLERTTATGTTLNTMTFGTVDYDVESNAVNNVSLALGHVVLTPGVSSGTDTLTYSGASGNGLAFVLPLTVSGPALAKIRTSTAVLGLGAVTATVRTATAYLYSPQQSKTMGTAGWVSGAPNYQQTVDPFDVVTLHAGTWTQISGPSVTLASNTFTAPGFAGGTVLVFQSGVNTETVTVGPWNFFIFAGGGMVGVPIRPL